MIHLLNQIRGCLYGVAVADALGAPVEFMSAEAIRDRHGVVREMLGGGWLNVVPGEVTDDTQMTLCVARGIVRSPEDPIEAIGQQMIAWVAGNPKDVGATCASSISLAKATSPRKTPTAKDWFAAARRNHRLSGGRSGGNGGLMRTAYLGLYYPPAEALFHAMRVCRMTHYDAVAAADCGAYSAAISRMIFGENCAKRRSILVETFDELGDAERYDYDMLLDDSFEPNPSGYGVDSLRAALHCLYTTDSFEEAIIKAVNLGGDADTIGAITGGLAGAIYGFSDIPKRWINALNGAVRSELDALSAVAKRARTHNA